MSNDEYTHRHSWVNNINMSYIQTIIEELGAKAQAEKERLIKLRIIERVGEDIDLLEEVQKRFPRIVREHHSVDQSEHWYWDNGTKEGLRLISFYQDFEQDIMSKDYKLSVLFKYE